MSSGAVWKRCTHDGVLRETGRPATSRRPAIPACRCTGGSWWWRITAGVDPVTYRRRQPMQGGYRTRRDAELALEEVRDQLRRGIFAWDQGKTLGVWLREWLEQGAAAGAWEPSTLTGYRSHVDLYLIPMLGHIRLRDLQRIHIVSMLAELARPDETRTKRGRGTGSVVVQRSPETIDRIRCTLRTALTAAVEDGLLAVNPAAGRFRQIGRRTPHQAAVWQPAELRAFLTHVERDRDVVLWRVVADTGLRRSEVCGLRWEDIDLDDDHPGLWVRQKCVDLAGPQPCHVCGQQHRGRQLRGDRGAGRGSKSAAGDGRWVPLGEEAVSDLRAHRIAQEARRDHLGVHWSDHGLVFPMDGLRDRDRPGSPRRPDSVTKRHAQLVAAAGLPPIHLHEMRHTRVSHLSAAGMPPEQIRLIVGHASDGMTRHYTHSIRSTLHERAQAASRLGDDE